MTVVSDYDPAAFPFSQAMRELLGVRDLANLRADTTGEADWSIYKAMENTALYDRLRAALLGPDGAEFRALYRRFITAEIRPGFDEPILYQTCPTVRLIFADVGGEPRFHRDRDYGHDAAEINYCVALTPMFASNAIWIESCADAGDYAPIELKPGEYARFDGASLRHGAIANETGCARVSFDFRVVPESRRANQEISHSEPPERLDAHLFARCP